jgi:competence protein ComEC
LWQGKVRWLGVLPIIIAVGFIAVRPRPDVLVGGQFRLLAGVKDDTGKLWLSSGRADKFVRQAWIEREGGAGSDVWPEQGSMESFLTCGERSCAFTKKGKTVLFLKDDAAASEAECGTADIIVTPKEKKPRGCGAAVIDKWDLYDYGTHLVYLGGPEPVITTVYDWRGERPWTGRRWLKN